MTDKKGLVLIVDDDDEMREVFEVAMRSFGYEVESVPDTASARKRLEQDPPVSLIMSDVMMPDGNGLDFCRWVRAHAKLKSTPMILCTGLKDEETMRDAMELGAVDFVRKPTSMQSLKEKIDRLHARGRAAQ